MKRLLALPGIHYVFSRFGSTPLRQAAYDAKYIYGTWRTVHSDKPVMLTSLVMQHLNGGRMLDLGCGEGSLAAALRCDSYSEFIGVDLSPVAISIANSRNCPNAVFICSDIREYIPDGIFNVIMFEESFYYLPSSCQINELSRYKSCLTDGGVVIITTSNMGRFKNSLLAIRKEFNTILHDQLFPGSSRHLMVIGNVNKATAI